MKELLVTHIRSVWVVFVTVGALIIFIWSQNATSADGFSGHFLLIVGVVIWMIFYAVYLWLRKSAGYASDMHGETFYYLGFILTLATLVFTFTPMLASGDVSNVKQVLGLFGLGLITTFVGLAGRVLFSSFESEEESAPDKEIAHLNGAIRELAQNTEAAANSIRIAHEGLSVHIDNLQKTQSALLDTHSKRMLDTLEGMVAATSVSIGRIASGAEIEVTEVATRLKEQVATIQFPSASTMSEFNAEVRKASKRASAVDEAFALVVSSAEGVREASGNAANGMNELANAATALGQKSKDASLVLDSLASSASGGGKEIRGLTTEAASLQPVFRALSDVVVSTTRIVSTPANELAKSLSAVDVALKEVASATDMMKASVTSLARDSNEARATLSSVVASLRALAESAGSTAEYSKSIAAALGASVAQVAELGEVVRRHNAGLEHLAATIRESVMRSQEDVRKVHENLIASSTYILNKLR